MNKVILMGRLARDPDVRTTQGGKSVARMTLAVDRRKSADGQQEADFLTLVAWEKLADIAANYLHKGSKILVDGRLQSRSYDAQDGTKRYVTEVIVSNLEFCESSRQEVDGAAAERGGIDGVPREGTGADRKDGGAE